MRQTRNMLLVAALLALLSPAGLAGQLIVDIGRGPVTVEIPSSYDPTRPYPLVLNLHGYTLTGQQQENYFQLVPWAESAGFLYAYPTGMLDFFSQPFWNATDACCDLFGNGVDDSTYLIDLVDEIRDRLSVDPWRVHFVGWSNGGFMSYRMACDHADTVASLMSLAGATFLDPTDCQPVAPVHVLQVHGTSDSTIGYNGGATTTASYPGAVVTVETWAGYNGCNVAYRSEPNRDLDASIAGAEAEVRIYDEACTPGGSARLWTIPGGPHGPSLAPGFQSGVVAFLLGHRRAGLRFDDEQTLVWPPVRWAQTYRVYRGTLAELVDTDDDGLADPGYGACVTGADPDPSDTTWQATDVPAPGTGYFYLVGFVDSDGAASILGSTPNGLPRAPSQACPD